MLDELMAVGLIENPEVVKSLKNNRVKKISRCYLDSTLSSIKESEPPIPAKEFFKTIDGSVLVYLENGDTIAFDGSEIWDSVVTCFYEKKNVNCNSSYIIDELCEFISSDDSNYSTSNEWSHMINETICSIKVLIIDQGEKPNVGNPFQRAIILETAKGDIAFSYKLLDLNGAPLLPITRKADIPQKYWNIAKVVEL